MRFLRNLFRRKKNNDNNNNNEQNEPQPEPNNQSNTELNNLTSTDNSTEPTEKQFYKGSLSSYEKQNQTKQIGDYKLIIDSPTLDVYKKDNNLLITLRGTVPTDWVDLKADGSLPFNNLTNTKRFEEDNEKFQAVIRQYPPSQFNYYLTGHSLGGAMVNQFKRTYPFVKHSVSFNSAFQPKDFFKNEDMDIKKIYMDKDFLFNSGGKL